MASLLLFLPLMITPPDTLSPEALQKLPPTSLYEWSFAEPSKTYTGREIFKYMDGAGEVYLAYGFQRLLVQRYACPGQEEILVEVFDMGFARNSFGAFTNVSGYGTPVEIGQGGEYKSGLLAFWKGRYFVCVLIDRENEAAKKAVHQLAALISEAIREQGALPDILRLLPPGEYFPETLKYFYKNEILNIHFYVADRNLFHLSGQTDAVLVRMKGSRSYLLLIQYLEADEAPVAFGDFTSRYMPESRGSGIIQTENKKWTACRRHRNTIAVVFDAPTQADAQTILETVQRRQQ